MSNSRFGLSRLFTPKNIAPPATAAQSAPLVLPADVRDAINGANINVRPNRQDDAPQVVVSIGLRTPFYYTDERFAGFMRERFPELSEGQIDMAMERMGYRIGAALAGADQRMQSMGEPRRPGRTPWINDY